MAAFILLAEEALNEERIERKRRRQHTRWGLSINLIPDAEFIYNYRLSRPLYERLCEDVVPLLPSLNRRSGIDPAKKILIALNFYAKGSYQGAVGLNCDVPMAQQTVSRCLRDVTIALNHPTFVKKYICFPQNAQNRRVIKQQFFEKYGIPGVVGCIDCTHIRIIRPAANEERFFNRKHFHSLNTQIISDAENLILNVDASYGGATHDAFIWSHHEIKIHLESLDDASYLLGDSGYPVREHMMTPIDNAAEDSPEGRYNCLHKRARSTIERTFGILKGRWRCLSRILHYTPDVSGKIVIACCVLHNMCIRAGLEAPPIIAEPQEDMAHNHQRNIAVPSQISLWRGQRARERLVQLLERNEL